MKNSSIKWYCLSQRMNIFFVQSIFVLCRSFDCFDDCEIAMRDFLMKFYEYMIKGFFYIYAMRSESDFNNL